MGRKGAKSKRDSDNLTKVNMENIRSIAETLNRRADVEEEKNAMRLFALAPCETLEEEEEKVEYFRTMRR